MADRMEATWHESRNHSRAKANRRSARAQGWKSRSRDAVSSSMASTRPLLRLLRLRSGARKESLEHPAPGSVAVVVAEHVFVHVGLQVLRGNPVIDPAHTATEQRPEALNRVGVNDPIDVDAAGVIDALVLVP